MRNYKLFGYLVFFGIAGVLAVSIKVFMFNDWPVYEKLIILGIWLIVAFFVLVGIDGAIRGVSKTKVGVPKMSAIFIFSISFLLFITAGLISDT